VPDLERDPAPSTSSPVPEWDEMVLVGFVARTHGNRGQVILNSESDFAEQRFRPGARLYARIAGGPVEVLEVTAVRFQQGRPIVGLAGFGTIDEAERLAGAELRVPQSDQEPLPDGVYYHHQLVGCEVITSAGEHLGRVRAIEGNGDATRIIVRGPRAEVMIPLAQEICAIDVAAKRIVVTPPAGLLEVNGEWRS
jgi:16S rRNA processing protein RimM